MGYRWPVDVEDHLMRVRLPPDVMQSLRAAVKESGRSLNGEILVRLRQSLETSPIEERLAALEALVLSDETGNDALWHKIDKEASRLEGLIETVGERGYLSDNDQR